MADSESLMNLTSLTGMVYSNTQAILAQITPTVNIGGIRRIFHRSIQRSLSSIEYGNRKRTRLPLSNANVTWIRDTANRSVED